MTLVIFSGVPDPVWWVHSRHESFEKITEHLHRARTTTKTYRHEHMPPILGYRGFLVHPPQAKKAELFVGQETKELQKLLLGSMPKDLIPDALRQKILHAIESTSMPHPASVAHQAQTPSRQKVLQAPSIGEKAVERIPHYAPQLNLPRWNTYDLIRSNNNCYDYANDKITNSFAQPGTASGHPYPRPITPEGVLTAAQSDGLVKLDVPPSAPCPEAPEQPNCLVALLVAPGYKTINSFIQSSSNKFSIDKS